MDQLLNNWILLAQGLIGSIGALALASVKLPHLTASAVGPGRRAEPKANHTAPAGAPGGLAHCSATHPPLEAAGPEVARRLGQGSTPIHKPAIRCSYRIANRRSSTEPRARSSPPNVTHRASVLNLPLARIRAASAAAPGKLAAQDGARGRPTTARREDDTTDEPTAEQFALAITPRPERACVYRGGASGALQEVAWPPADGAPFAVFIADGGRYRCLALDFDDGDVRADTASVSALLRAAGIEHVETVSGPVGHRHILATFDPPLPGATVAAIAHVLARRHTSLDPKPLLDPATSCVRPPLAPHRSGGVSTPVGDPQTALRTLQRGNGLEEQRRLLELLDLAPRAPDLMLQLGWQAPGAQQRVDGEHRRALDCDRQTKADPP